MGRPVGSKNKVSGQAKENIHAVFVRLGGTAAMAKWAEANKGVFYASIYPKILPHEITGANGGAIVIQSTSPDDGLV